MSEENKSIHVSPVFATVFATFVTLVISGAGYIASELKSTHTQTREIRKATLEAVAQVRTEAKQERDRYRDEILRSIGEVRAAAKQLEDRMFSQREHELYVSSVQESQRTLAAKILALETTLTRHLDNTALAGFAETQ